MLEHPFTAAGCVDSFICMDAAFINSMLGVLDFDYEICWFYILQSRLHSKLPQINSRPSYVIWSKPCPDLFQHFSINPQVWSFNVRVVLVIFLVPYCLLIFAPNFFVWWVHLLTTKCQCQCVDHSFFSCQLWFDQLTSAF